VTAGYQPEDRYYPALFLAMDDALETLFEGSPAEDALRRSFEGAAEGFGAEKALLLVVEPGEPPRLRSLASRGLSGEEISACEAGRSVPGVSSSRIREAITSRKPILIQDPRHLQDARRTDALEGGAYSVLCAPLIDRATGTALAVLYFQNHGLTNAFGEIDRAWIEVYARALGRVIAQMQD
jgi:hypothetical protein